MLGAKDLEYVAECVRTGWVSSAGRFIEEFEERWAAYCGRRYGVAVSNGTTALQLAVAALQLDPGDEVIMPAFTIISCALAVRYNGGFPALVDSDSTTWGVDVKQIEKKITPRTRAIMPVHIYGHPVDIDPILAIADAHGLAVIEDAAEAHGAAYLSGRNSNPVWRRCGSFGTLSCFSFYANKLITTGEGGMVLTDDPALDARIRSLRNLCFQSERRFYHEELGFNGRLTNLQAALGLAQLDRIDAIVARKRSIGREYRKRLAGVPGLQLATEEDWAQSVYWMFGIVPSEETGWDGRRLAEALRARGVETRPFFVGMHEQPVFRRSGLFVDERYPVAEYLTRQGVYLPSGMALTDTQLARVCEAVHEVLS